MLKNYTIATAMLLTVCASTVTHADSTLVYEMTNKAGNKTEYTIGISGRWMRLDSSPKGTVDYSIMDMGRLLKFDIKDRTKSFQLTRMGRLYWPESPLNSPAFKPIKKKNAIAEVRCQPVNEIDSKQKPVIEHCMASGGSMRLNAREMITLSRLFMYTRRMGDNMLGVATPDERQVSVLSQNTNGEQLVLKSVSHGKIDSTRLKIPVDYKQLKPDLPLKTYIPKKPEAAAKQKLSARPASKAMQEIPVKK